MSRHVYFDLDGTLTDPFEGISKCIAYALQRLGIPVPGDDVLKSCIGPPLLGSFERLAGTDRAELGLAYYRERFGDIGWRENRVYDGIASILGTLSGNGERLFVAIGARDNGMRAIGVAWGYGTAGELERAGASSIAGRPEDLPGMLG